MIDLLIQNKKTTMMAEKDIPCIKQLYHDESLSNIDPVLYRMRQINYHSLNNQSTSEFNTDRIMITFMGWFPSLFNKVVISNKEIACSS